MIVEAWDAKAMFARLAPKIPVSEFGSVLLCVRLLESRRKGISALDVS